MSAISKSQTRPSGMLSPQYHASYQTISLLSPIIPTNINQSKPRPNFLTIKIIPPTNYYAQEQSTHGDNKYSDNGNYTLETKSTAAEEYFSYDSLYSAASPSYNEHVQDALLTRAVEVGELPPIPTYQESQLAYYPHGIKRLPHFHPPRYSKRSVYVTCCSLFRYPNGYFPIRTFG